MSPLRLIRPSPSSTPPDDIPPPHPSAASPQIRITLQCFACYNAVSSEQMRKIFKALRYETDRCTAAVVLWSRTIDREGIYEAFRELSPVEQRQV